MVTSASELLGDVKTGGNQGCSDHVLVELTLLREVGITKSIVRTLKFRRANFQLFKEIVRRTPWERVLQDRGTELRWQVFKDVFQRAQELSIPSVRSRAEKGRDWHG